MSRRRSVELTDRQRAFLQQRADGNSYAEIATLHGVPESTIRGQIEQTHIKLGARSSLNAIAIGFRKGVIR